MMQRLLPLAALLFALVPCPCSQLGGLGLSGGRGPQVGDSAPDFTLTSLDGEVVTLSALWGQIVVLDFWATWCNPCTESLPHIQALHDEYADQGVVVLAIDLKESAHQVADIIAGEYTFTVLLDGDGQVSADYGMWGIPHTVVIDREGKVYAIPPGPEAVEREVRALLGE